MTNRQQGWSFRCLRGYRERRAGEERAKPTRLKQDRTNISGSGRTWRVSTLPGTFRSPTICHGDKAISPLRAIIPFMKREFVLQLRRCHRSKLFEDWMLAVIATKYRRSPVVGFFRVIFKRERTKLNSTGEGKTSCCRKRSHDFSEIVETEEDSDQSTGNPAKSRRLQVSYPSRRNRYTQEEWLLHPAKRQTPLLPLTHQEKIKNEGKAKEIQKHGSWKISAKIVYDRFASYNLR